MPLTTKGKSIYASMVRQYGRKKGRKVFYASASAKTIKGAHR